MDILTISEKEVITFDRLPLIAKIKLTKLSQSISEKARGNKENE